ncbi:Hypothetical protein NTJ_15490 [Nesidiocoris tenuis]|uniref:Uncharacterized protein n=1 Tax=Nesidiocoris tenuis TaxID=355587 RepID=A0ABN7BE75_9HEMI|nr:Hypothetical protein NTJ_15490 [Nesidiocoris tenuis]
MRQTRGDELLEREENKRVRVSDRERAPLPSRVAAGGVHATSPQPLVAFPRRPLGQFIYSLAHGGSDTHTKTSWYFHLAPS